MTTQGRLHAVAINQHEGRNRRTEKFRYPCSLFAVNQSSVRRAVEARGFNAIEKLTFSAAAKDAGFSRHLHAYGARMIGPARFLSPAALLRAAWINLRKP